MNTQDKIDKILLQFLRSSIDTEELDVLPQPEAEAAINKLLVEAKVDELEKTLLNTVDGSYIRKKVIERIATLRKEL